MPAQKNIVILGGGIGALTAAYYLTDQPGWQQKYDVITVYQLGWRLGGKCASSRNSARSDRIEEHGLHVWFGFYQNAFALLRSCYAGLGRPSPLDPARGTFEPRDHASMLEQDGARWWPWYVPFPQSPGEPGDPGNGERSFWSVLTALVRFAMDYAHSRLSAAEIAASPLTGAYDLMASLDPDPANHTVAEEELLRNLLTASRSWIDASQFTVAASQPRDWVRIRMVMDLSLTIGIGILEDGLLFRGLRAVDDMEFLSWLRKHGARKETADIGRCLPVRALYDTCFAFNGGDWRSPNFAAGVALGCALRIGFTYWGHVLYLMKAGMGDVVIAPLYELLARRGVRFEFFQRVTAIDPDATGRIARICFSRQATPSGGTYDPLVGGGTHARWPPEPLYDQLDNGAALHGIDFESHWYDKSHDKPWDLAIGPDDQVVLGISLGALPQLCAGLGSVHQKWRRLLANLPTIQTQSMQLWLTRTSRELGWTPHAPPTMVAAPEPHDVWADMSHVLAAESWPPKGAPASVQYYCGPMEGDYLRDFPGDPNAPQLAHRQVRATAIDWLERYAGWAFSGSARPFDWSVLHGGSHSGPDRIDDQWLRANIDPTERYVLSPAGANLLRLPSDDSEFANLVLAGDWTRTAINAGCVEAAVMSGMAASRKLCGWPRIIHGENFMPG